VHLKFVKELWYNVITRKSNHLALSSTRSGFGTSLLLRSLILPLNIPSVDLTRSLEYDHGDLTSQRPHEHLDVDSLHRTMGTVSDRILHATALPVVIVRLQSTQNSVRLADEETWKERSSLHEKTIRTQGGVHSPLERHISPFLRVRAWEELIPLV
jgi:hypothetical protein